MATVSAWKFRKAKKKLPRSLSKVSPAILLQCPINNSPLISGSKNVLSAFVSNPQYDGTLRMIHFHQEGQGRKIRFLPLRKIRSDVFVTDPVSLDGPPSKVRLFGTDSENKTIEENISPVSTDTRKIRFHC
jgi:hypothetical protein